jgi:hypothetical protein
MKVCHCFIGLLRCIQKTAENFKSNLFASPDECDIVCITWESEDTFIFTQLFPEALVFKVPDIIEKGNNDFEAWRQGLQLHISLRRSEEEGWPYNGNSGAFHYYRQLYLLRKASEYLELLQKAKQYDIMTRLRTDIIIHSGEPIFEHFPAIAQSSKKLICFANEPRHFIKKEGEGCPDQFYMGSPDAIIMALKSLDYTRKYRITYTETSSKWFPTPQLEENIIQPESILYYFLTGEGYTLHFLHYRIEIVRN